MSDLLTKREKDEVHTGVKKYLHTLFQWPGRWISVPVAVNPFYCIEVKNEIWEQTRQSLRLMGVSFRENKLELSFWVRQ